MSRMRRVSDCSSLYKTFQVEIAERNPLNLGWALKAGNHGINWISFGRTRNMTDALTPRNQQTYKIRVPANIILAQLR